MLPSMFCWISCFDPIGYLIGSNGAGEFGWTLIFISTGILDFSIRQRGFIVVFLLPGLLVRELLIRRLPCSMGRGL